jgi:hypothetical protein
MVLDDAVFDGIIFFFELIVRIIFFHKFVKTQSQYGGAKDVRLRCRCCTQRSTQATVF